MKLRYDWDVPDMPSVHVCEDHFNVQATFMSLGFSTTGGMVAEYTRYHSRLAELVVQRRGKAT